MELGITNNELNPQPYLEAVLSSIYSLFPWRAVSEHVPVETQWSITACLVSTNTPNLERSPLNPNLSLGAGCGPAVLSDSVLREICMLL